MTATNPEKRPDFVYVIYIEAPAEKVYAALTQGDLSQKYWGGRQVESDWTPGSPVHFRKADGEYDVVRARVLEARPPHGLTMAWTYAMDPQPPASKVTYQIQKAGPSTVKLTVMHEVWEVGSEVDDGLKQGWPAILSALKTFLESGERMSVTRQWEEQGL